MRWVASWLTVMTGLEEQNSVPSRIAVVPGSLRRPPSYPADLRRSFPPSCPLAAVWPIASQPLAPTSNYADVVFALINLFIHLLSQKPRSMYCSLLDMPGKLFLFRPSADDSECTQLAICKRVSIWRPSYQGTGRCRLICEQVLPGFTISEFHGIAFVAATHDAETIK